MTNNGISSSKGVILIEDDDNDDHVVAYQSNNSNRSARTIDDQHAHMFRHRRTTNTNNQFTQQRQQHHHHQQQQQQPLTIHERRRGNSNNNNNNNTRQPTTPSSSSRRRLDLTTIPSSPMTSQSRRQFIRSISPRSRTPTTPRITSESRNDNINIDVDIKRPKTPRRQQQQNHHHRQQQIQQQTQQLTNSRTISHSIVSSSSMTSADKYKILSSSSSAPSTNNSSTKSNIKHPTSLPKNFTNSKMMIGGYREEETINVAMNNNGSSTTFNNHLSWRYDPNLSFSDWTIEILSRRQQDVSIDGRINNNNNSGEDDGEDKDESSSVHTLRRDIYHCHSNVVVWGPRKSGVLVALFQKLLRSSINNHKQKGQPPTPRGSHIKDNNNGDNSNINENRDNNHKMSRIELNPNEADTFPLMLDFIYCENKLPLNAQRSCALYVLGEKFQVPTLKAAIEEYVEASLNLSQMIEFMTHAKQYHVLNTTEAGERLMFFASSKLCGYLVKNPKHSKYVPPNIMLHILHKRSLCIKVLKGDNPREYSKDMELKRSLILSKVVAECITSKTSQYNTTTKTTIEPTYYNNDICIAPSLTYALFKKLTSRQYLPVIESNAAIKLLQIDEALKQLNKNKHNPQEDENDRLLEKINDEDDDNENCNENDSNKNGEYLTCLEERCIHALTTTWSEMMKRISQINTNNGQDNNNNVNNCDNNKTYEGPTFNSLVDLSNNLRKISSRVLADLLIMNSLDYELHLSHQAKKSNEQQQQDERYNDIQQKRNYQNQQQTLLLDPNQQQEDEQQQQSQQLTNQKLIEQQRRYDNNEDGRHIHGNNSMTSTNTTHVDVNYSNTKKTINQTQNRGKSNPISNRRNNNNYSMNNTTSLNDDDVHTRITHQFNNKKYQQQHHHPPEHQQQEEDRYHPRQQPQQEQRAKRSNSIVTMNTTCSNYNCSTFDTNCNIEDYEEAEVLRRMQNFASMPVPPPRPYNPPYFTSIPVPPPPPPQPTTPSSNNLPPLPLLFLCGIGAGAGSSVVGQTTHTENDQNFQNLFSFGTSNRRQRQ